MWRSEAQARAETLWGLEQADVVKLSDEELSFLWGCTPEEGARRLREECGVALAMITLGPQGCYLENARGACRVPAPAVRPVDTTGAGDIFGAAPWRSCWPWTHLRRSWSPARWRASPASPSPPPACPPSAPAASPPSPQRRRCWPLWKSNRRARRVPAGSSNTLQAVEKPSPKEGLGNDTSHGGRGDNFAGNRAPSAIQSFSAGCITLCGS
ncbi:MAG: carbohydrate kinase family protein [Flavonifractor plautii]